MEREREGVVEILNNKHLFIEIILIIHYYGIHAQYIISSTLIINLAASEKMKHQSHAHINTVCNPGKAYS